MTQSIFDDEKQEERDQEPVVLAEYQPVPIDENVRQESLAWSAGIVFFSSVAFCLFLGWLADLLLGTSPWGIVTGIVLGSVIGFVQFFRLSSQIFGSTTPGPAEHPLMPRDEDKNNEHL